MNDPIAKKTNLAGSLARKARFMVAINRHAVCGYEKPAEAVALDVCAGGSPRWKLTESYSGIARPAARLPADLISRVSE